MVRDNMARDHSSVSGFRKKNNKRLPVSSAWTFENPLSNPICPWCVSYQAYRDFLAMILVYHRISPRATRQIEFYTCHIFGHFYRHTHTHVLLLKSQTWVYWNFHIQKNPPFYFSSFSRVYIHLGLPMACQNLWENHHHYLTKGRKNIHPENYPLWRRRTQGMYVCIYIYILTISIFPALPRYFQPLRWLPMPWQPRRERLNGDPII